MAVELGDRATFAVVVGEFWHAPDLRCVDLWAGGQRLTDDESNCAYLPTLRHHMRLLASEVRDHQLPPCPFPELAPEENLRVLRRDEDALWDRLVHLTLDELLDHVSVWAYMDELVVLVVELRGGIFSARIEVDAFAGTLETAADIFHPAS